MLGSNLITAIILGAAAIAATTPGAATTTTPANAVPFRTLAIVDGVEGFDLWGPGLLRVGSNSDVDWLRDLLADGEGNPFVERVAGAIGDIPDGRVVLIGVIDISCTPATTAALVRGEDGHLNMFAPGHVPEQIGCFVPVVTVGVLSVDAGDAPPGSTDHAELVAFGFAGYEPLLGHNATELAADDAALHSIMPGDATAPSLPPLADGDRRFAFSRIGCQHTTAELLVTRLIVDARLAYDEPGVRVDCARAEWYVAVFDIPTEIVLDSAVLVGSRER